MNSNKQTQTNDRFTRETEEFFSLYPDVDLDEIPDEVWKNVMKGQSLVQAYGEYSEKSGEKKAKAEKINEKNKDSAPGSVSGNTKTGYYTAKQVAVMTDAQVRENYNAILESMSAPGFYDN